MSKSIDSQEKRLAELKREITKRGFNRHASRLQTVSELPVELQSSRVAALAVQEDIQSIIFFPQQIQRGWHYVPKRALLFTSTGVVHLLGSIWPGEEPQVRCLEGCGLLYMKVTLLLLYGFLEIVAQGQDSPIRLGMEFNTVAWCFLSSPLRQFLRASHAQVGSSASSDKISSLLRRQALETLPIKFANGVKIYGLLPGEELEELVFQPGSWKRWLHFFQKPVLANTLLLLTTNYMVVIGEDLDVNQGWLLSYIPRSNIIGIQQRSCSQWDELSVQIRRGEQAADFEFVLANEAVEDWRIRWMQHGGHWQTIAAPIMPDRS